MAEQNLDGLIEKYRGTPGALIPVLQQAQEILGYLAPETLAGIAKGLKVPLSRVYSVVTFYAQFYLTPRGRNTVKACRGTACHVRGAKSVLNKVRDKLGVEDGGTTPDMNFTFETVACLGACALAPVMVVNKRYYGGMTTRKVETILEQYAPKEAPADEKT